MFGPTGLYINLVPPPFSPALLAADLLRAKGFGEKNGHGRRALDAEDRFIVRQLDLVLLAFLEMFYLYHLYGSNCFLFFFFNHVVLSDVLTMFDLAI